MWMTMMQTEPKKSPFWLMSAHILETSFLPFLLLRWVQQVTKLAGWLFSWLMNIFMRAQLTLDAYIVFSYITIFGSSLPLLCLSVYVSTKCRTSHRCCFFPIATHFDTFLLLSEGNEILIYRPMCRSRCRIFTTKPLFNKHHSECFWMVWAFGGARKRTTVIVVWCYAYVLCMKFRFILNFQLILNSKMTMFWHSNQN